VILVWNEAARGLYNDKLIIFIQFYQVCSCKGHFFINSFRCGHFFDGPIEPRGPAKYHRASDYARFLVRRIGRQIEWLQEDAFTSLLLLSLRSRSRPHYRGELGSYFQDVQGLTDYDPERDDSYLDVEPTTGTPLGIPKMAHLSHVEINDIFSIHMQERPCQPESRCNYPSRPTQVYLTFTIPMFRLWRLCPSSISNNTPMSPR